MSLGLLQTACTPPTKPDPVPVLPEPLGVDDRSGSARTAPLRPETPAARRTQVERMPVPPRAAADRLGKTPAPVAREDGRADINLNFEQVPLTTLIQVVYSDILGRSVNLDDKVMARRDLVTFRSPVPQTPAQVNESMQLLLRSYGLAAVDLGGLVRVVPDDGKQGALPEIRRGDALPETPDVLRPVFQIIELKAVRNTDIAGWIKNLFGDKVQLSEDAGRNAVILSGTSDNVAAAIEVIRLLDQPLMRGRASLRITPAYWAATELADQLQEVLAAEGYAMPSGNASARGGGVRYPVLIVPVAPSNTLLVFANSEDILNHVREWVMRLDQPLVQPDDQGFFTYTVQNTTAGALAKTLNQVLSGESQSRSKSQTSTAKTEGAQTGTQSTEIGASLSIGGNQKIVVDETTNTLIFQGRHEEYARLSDLLRVLDRPRTSALIEVTIAEVRLTDENQLGVEWLLGEFKADGSGLIEGNLQGLGATGGGSGLTVRYLSGGAARLVVNALASSNRATILSSPRVMARNGEKAMIQVGQDVPIITSQSSSLEANTTSDTNVLQTIEYRSTGVILNVKPIIHSSDRIDLDIEQEVSAVEKTETGVNTSPTIKTRKMQTNLTLKNGATVLLGGLIADDSSRGNSGVPVLKDVPVLGALFRKDSRKREKTELIALITPYIVSDDRDAESLTEAFKSRLPWLETDGR